MEMRLEDLKREKLKNEDSQCGTSDINTESYVGDPSCLAESCALSIHRSESSTVLMYEYIEERNQQRKEQAVVDEQRRSHNELIAQRFQLDLLGAHGLRARDEPSIFLKANRRLSKQRFSFTCGLYADGPDDNDQDDGSACVGGLSLRTSMRTKKTEAKESDVAS